MVVDNFLTLLVTAGALLTAALASVGWSAVFVLERRVTGWWAVDLSLAVFCGWFALIYTLVLFGEISGPAAGIYLRPATNGLMFSLACMSVRFIDPRGHKLTQLRHILNGLFFGSGGSNRFGHAGSGIAVGGSESTTRAEPCQRCAADRIAGKADRETGSGEKRTPRPTTGMRGARTARRSPPFVARGQALGGIAYSLANAN